jgi:hypothetical protein
MKGTVSYLLGAAALLLLGVVCWQVADFEREIAAAQRNFATMTYDNVEDTFERAERYFRLGRYVPGIGSGPLNDILARKAELHYWQRRYDSIVPRGDDPLALLPADNVELQFVAANAVYRGARAAGLAEGKADDRDAALHAIDAGIRAYLVVLKNSARHDDAAFNYEYLLLQRGALLAGAGTPAGATDGEESTPHGQAGGAPQQTEMNDFKIQIPLDPKEFEDQKEGQEAGKNVARERRG